MTSQPQPAIFTSIETGVSIEACVAFQGTMSHTNAEVPIGSYHTKIAFISQSQVVTHRRESPFQVAYKLTQIKESLVQP